jgi:hypothetical protein
VEYRGRICLFRKTRNNEVRISSCDVNNMQEWGDEHDVTGPTDLPSSVSVATPGAYREAQQYMFSAWGNSVRHGTA